MKTELTLSEKTTAMEKSIKMAKEVHTKDFSTTGVNQWGNNPPTPNPNTEQFLETAKTIYDWIINS
jgi:hypothetical protein